MEFLMRSLHLAGVPVPGEGGRLARRPGHLAQDICSDRIRHGIRTPEVAGRAVCADVPGKMPGTAGKMPALPGKRPSAAGICVTRLVLLAALVCAWAAAAGCAARAAGEETGGTGSATLELKGLLTPLDQANLSSRSTGVIREMKQEGDEVHKGQVVVSLEDDAEKLQVDSAQAVLDKRRFEADSATKLHEKGTDSEDEARTAQTNLKTEEIQLKQALVAEDKKNVKAPFDGVVTRRIREVGEAVDQYFPLLTVVNLSKVYLETYLPANRLGDVQQGQSVEVRVPDLPGRSFKGQVFFIAPVIDPASGEFRLKILLPNADRALRSGMTAIGILELTHTTPTANPAPPSQGQTAAH
jgi:RND family efflux transporter MFP subunit